MTEPSNLAKLPMDVAKLVSSFNRSTIANMEIWFNCKTSPREMVMKFRATNCKKVDVTIERIDVPDPTEDDQKYKEGEISLSLPNDNDVIFLFIKSFIRCEVEPDTAIISFSCDGTDPDNDLCFEIDDLRFLDKVEGIVDLFGKISM